MVNPGRFCDCMTQEEYDSLFCDEVAEPAPENESDQTPEGDSDQQFEPEEENSTPILNPTTPSSEETNDQGDEGDVDQTETDSV